MFEYNELEPSNDVDREPTYEELKAYIIEDYKTAHQVLCCYVTTQPYFMLARRDTLGEVLVKHFGLTYDDLDQLREQSFADLEEKTRNYK